MPSRGQAVAEPRALVLVLGELRGSPELGRARGTLAPGVAASLWVECCALHAQFVHTHVCMSRCKNTGRFKMP